VNVPERVNGLRHLRVPASTTAKSDHWHGAVCVPNAGAHVVESTFHGTVSPYTCDGATVIVTATVSL